MSESVSVSIPHRLGKDEALRRIKSGFGEIRARLHGVVEIEEEDWQGDAVRFSMRGLGQTAAGHIVVRNDRLDVEFKLPWLLARLASTLLPAVRRETAKLLGPG